MKLGKRKVKNGDRSESVSVTSMYVGTGIGMAAV